MNRFNLISSKFNDNKSKLYFSRPEFNKILEYYLNGVSKGNWKDYAINFSKNEASFLMFKNTVGFPDCVLTKSLRNKKNKFIYKLQSNHHSKNNNFNHIDELLIILKRKNLKII